jgi:hypothetical protein
MITYERASELLEYNPDTGALTWKQSRGRVSEGSIAGHKQIRACAKPKAMDVRIDRVNYKAHRIAWLLHYKEFPRLYVDHINGNPYDNRICNLREATASENQHNMTTHKDNKSGRIGVSFHSGNQMWRAQISSNYVHYHIGYFDTPEEAYRAYCKKAKEIHGEFFNTGQETYENLQQ